MRYVQRLLDVDELEVIATWNVKQIYDNRSYAKIKLEFTSLVLTKTTLTLNKIYKSFKTQKQDPSTVDYREH